jgi:hypothetical protein
LDFDRAVKGVFIFEFEFKKTAQEAIEQIEKKKYASKYQVLYKMITGIGVNFNNDEDRLMIGRRLILRLGNGY